MTTQYQINRQAQQILDAEYTAACRELNEFINANLEMNEVRLAGLTPDRIKSMPGYKVLRAKMENKFAVLRNFNGKFTKEFKKEIAAERSQKYNKVI
jgi:hypothetical protein